MFIEEPSWILLKQKSKYLYEDLNLDLHIWISSKFKIDIL